MNSSHVARRSALLAPLALALATLSMLLCSPAATLAAAGRAGCAGASARSGSTPRACVQRRRKAHKHAKVKPHHAKHPSINKKQAVHGAAGTVTGASTAQTPAVCESGVRPRRGADGSYSCADGSEPSCADGSDPILSSSSAVPLCVIASAPGGAPALCEDASAPVRGPGGSFSCDDESEAECEEGGEPAPSSDGSTLVCPLAASPDRSTAGSSPGAEREAVVLSPRVVPVS